jgi:hypothetical protein
MAGYYCAKTCRGGIEVELGDIVDDVERNAAEFQRLRFRNGARPRADIVVAAHRAHRRDLAQRSQDRRVADVAGVDDVLAWLKEAQRFGTKQAVRVRDQAYADQAAAAGRRSTK